ncbi:hypothetical protein POTOM_049473 [Populus tomentosa]|uniref:Poor homologous synapsis 1 PH domain-containing protein n=1 Tax=Populus tomentosa TaxID=118781 RepID=A0A8X8C961_POPTO|nr:hypothetical protein POTOM_049473 [Populus tomentosa]
MFSSLPSSTCHTLQPQLFSQDGCMKDNPFGVWVSASSMASVQLIFNKEKRKNTVTFKGKIYVSCLEACPVRGSRVVFASYRDGLGQANFFPMMRKLVVACLKDIRNVGLPSSKLESDVSPPSEHISSNVIQDRTAEKLSNASPVGICDHTHSAATLAPLPASISAHLSGSCTKAIQEPATMPLPCDLSFQIRVLFQPCNLDSWISDGFANSISHSVTWGALHEFITFLSKVIE